MNPKNSFPSSLCVAIFVRGRGFAAARSLALLKFASTVLQFPSISERSWAPRGWRESKAIAHAMGLLQDEYVSSRSAWMIDSGSVLMHPHFTFFFFLLAALIWAPNRSQLLSNPPSISSSLSPHFWRYDLKACIFFCW